MASHECSLETVLHEHRNSQPPHRWHQTQQVSPRLLHRMAMSTPHRESVLPRATAAWVWFVKGQE